MLNNLLRVYQLLVCLLLVLFSFALKAQVITGYEQNVPVPLEVQRVLMEWQVYRLNAAELQQLLAQAPENASLTFRLGDRYEWELQLQPSRVLAPGYFLQVATEDGPEIYRRPRNIAFRGYETKGLGKVRLCVDKDFIYGFVEVGSERYYLEPLWYHQPEAARDLFLVYPKSAVRKDLDHGTCTELAAEEHEHYWEKNKGDAPEASGCYEIEIAIASDKSMFNKYGSVGAVEARNIGIINNVQGDYTGVFNHDMNFVIVTQFVVTGNDPWTSSNDAGELLASFRNWGNANGFGVPFDNGELWTNRNFNGNTIGIAYLNGMCNSNKYHCLQDFSNNSELLRCLTSHEIGHNMSANHDPVGGGSCPTNYIMCPFVTTSDIWSNNSVNLISNYITNRINAGCFQPCGANQPLTANFDWSPNPACRLQPVQFTDQSTGNVTSRSWQFPGGSPAASTQQNPVVTWSTAGTYNVVLTVSGPGGTASVTKPVLIKPTPSANFTFTYSGLTYTFINTSQNATTFSWDFGDGNTSNQENPVHTYAEAGIYTVVLTVQNECATATKTVVINTVPTADFTADPTTGCAPLVVQFTNLSSSNATSFIWQFPGGAPAGSNLKNPIVSYQQSGVYSVTLTAINSSGTNQITKTNYITVQNIPSSNFNFTVDTLKVTFNNTSQGATSFLWNFGDGDTSTLQNPIHIYAQSGTYTVTLTATNACGSNTSTKTVTVVGAPVANFTASPTSGCAPLNVQFTSTSQGNPTSFQWHFPGGSPSSSTAQNPTVTYDSSGAYSVTLIVTNNLGSDTLTRTNYITVIPPPTAGFTVQTNGFEASFTNTSSNATTYEWDFGDGNGSTEQNPTHTYAQDGTYTVTLTATGPCGTSTFTQTVTIATPPTAGFTASPTADCGPLTVQFTNTSSNNASTFLWLFPGGTPSSSTEENPVVTYTSSGTYSVTLIVSNAQGSDTLTQVDYIQVFVDAQASFSSTVNGATVVFQNTSNNANTYLWDFGDGNTSTAPNPTHTYAQDGTYTVTLTASNSCGSSTFTQTITIVTPPTAGFAASPTTGCAPLTVQFTNTSSANATEFFWEFPGGNPASSTEQNPVVTYDSPGTYSVTLTASNSAGSSTVTQTDLIVVVGQPTAAFSTSVLGATVSFTNQSYGATSYQWDFGDGNSSTTPDPTHTYAASGTYTVVLSAFNDCGSTTSTQTVTILLPPVAAFSASATEGCAPLTVTFTNESSADASAYEWTFEGGTPPASTETNPTVVFETPGVFTVTLVAINAAGSSTSTATIVVQGPPTAGFTVQTAGLSVVLTNTTQNATSFRWDFGDGNTSTEPNPTHTYALPGAYFITLRAENACGTSEVSVQVEILGTPPIAGFKPSVTQGCLPLVVQFTDLSAGNPVAWNWSFPGGTPSSSTEQNPVVTYSSPGIYSVTLVVTNAYGADSVTQQGLIQVLALPTANFAFNITNLTVEFINQSQNGTSYSWSFGDGNTSNEVSPTHTYANPGTYTVSLTVLNNCGATTLQKTIVLTSSVRDAAWLHGLMLYPNPSAGRFTVDMRGEPASEVTFVLWDVTGRLLHQATADFNTGALKQVFELPELADGLYTLQVRRGDSVVYMKVSIQRP